MRPRHPFPLLPIFSQEDVHLARWLLRAQALRRHAGWLRLGLACCVIVGGSWACLRVVPCAVGLCCYRDDVDDVRNQAFEVGKSIELYRLQQGEWPSDLSLLVTPPKGRPLMERVPLDAWGRPYHLLIPGLRNPSKFDVLSYGPDGLPYTADDLGNWPE